MEGSGAPDTDVETYSRRIDQTKEGKTIYSAMVTIIIKHSKLLSTKAGFNGISFKIKYEGKEIQDDMKNRPCIEIPMDWSNEKAEVAGKNKRALCLETWGNRRMI